MAQIIPGIYLRGFGVAFLAVAVIAIVNSTLGFVLRIVTFPLTLLTLGLFLLILNALLLKLAAALVPGFAIRGFLPAILGSIVLTVLNWALREVVF